MTLPYHSGRQGSRFSRARCTGSKFRARADGVRMVRFAVVQNGGDGHDVGLDGTVTIGSDWRQYVIYFRATATDPAAQLNFYFGDQPGNISLDGVVLQGTAR